MTPRYLIAALLALTLTACGSRGPLVYPPPADGQQPQSRPSGGANPNMSSPIDSEYQR